jgi:hypothetical protein
VGAGRVGARGGGDECERMSVADERGTVQRVLGADVAGRQPVEERPRPSRDLTSGGLAIDRELDERARGLVAEAR